MRLTLVFIAGLLALDGTARAEDAKLAREHFQAGSKLYDLGKFAEAAREYEAAYQAKSDPALLFNIGQAYRAAGDAHHAILAYRAYLRNAPDAANRADVEGHIARLNQLLDEQRAQPTPSPPPAQTPTSITTPPAAAAAAPRPTPIYKKWWLWTAVGGAVAVGVVAGLVAGVTPNDARSPSNTFGVTLR